MARSNSCSPSWYNNGVVLSLIPHFSPANDAFEHISWNDLNSVVQGLTSTSTTTNTNKELLQLLKLSNEQLKLLEFASSNPIEYVISSLSLQELRQLVQTLLTLIQCSVGVVVTHTTTNNHPFKIPSKKVATFSTTSSHYNSSSLQLSELNHYQHAARLAECIMLAQDYDPIGVIVHWSVFYLYQILVSLLDHPIPSIHKTAYDVLIQPPTNNHNKDYWTLLIQALRDCPTYDTYLSTMLAFLLTQMFVIVESSSSYNSQHRKEVLQQLLGWVCDGLAKSSTTSPVPQQTNSSIPILLPTLLTLLSESKLSRQLFIQHGGIGYLSRHLRSGTTIHNHPIMTTSSLVRIHTPNGSNTTLLTSTRSAPTTLTTSNNSNNTTTKGLEPVQSMQMNRVSIRQPHYWTAPLTNDDVDSTRNNNLDTFSEMSKDYNQKTLEGVGFDASLSNSTGRILPTSSNTTNATLHSTLPSTKEPIHHNATTISNTTRNNNRTNGSQQLYYLTFCLWTLTLELLNTNNHSNTTTNNEEMMLHSRFLSDGAVSTLCGLVQSKPREKVFRLSIASLYNLSHSSVLYVKEMIACGLWKTINHIQDRPLTDEEQSLCMILNNYTIHHVTTNWETYQMQVETGTMTWNELHSESFFQRNYKKFEHDNFYVVSLLISYVVGSTSDRLRLPNGVTVHLEDDLLALACNDIGEFVKFYPNGRSIVKRFGATESIMQLMYHESDIVRHHALRCVSKLLVRQSGSEALFSRREK